MRRVREFIGRRSSTAAAVLLPVLVLFVGGIAVAIGAEDTAPAGDTTAAPVSDTPSPEASASSTEDVSASDDPASSGTGSVNNEVVVLNQTDNSFKHRAGFATTRVTGDTVNNQNSAAAYSRCNSCRTVAVAAQVVLVQTKANVVTPKNVAVALNYECRACETFAGAYQYVVSTDGAVRFTPEGERRMADIQNEIRATAALDIPFPELDARLGALIDELWATVDAEMVKIGAEFTARPYETTDSDDSEGDPVVSPAPTESSGSGTSTEGDAAAGSSGATDEPSPSPTPSPTPTGTESPMPSREESPTA